MKKLLKLKTLRGSLVFYQVLLMSLILLLAGYGAYFYISNTVIEMIKIEQESLGTSVTSSIENELEKMNNVSMNISYSNIIKDMFKDYYLSTKPGPYSGTRVQKYNEQSLLLGSILGIMGPFQYVSQVYLYTLDGFMIGSGLFNEESYIDILSKEKLTKAIELNGYKHLTIPERSELLGKRYFHLKDESFISLIRVFKDQHHRDEGIVEVQQVCNRIFSSIEMQDSGERALNIYVINNDLEFLYPYEENELTQDEIDNIKQIISSRLTSELPEDSLGNIISIFDIEDYGLKVIFTQSKEKVLSRLRQIKTLFTIFIAFILLYTLAVSYYASYRVSNPINSLIKSISDFQLRNIPGNRCEPITPIGKSFEEIDVLYNEFSNMIVKLQTSIDELIALKDHEALTRLLTLQSQMNPHFLYNNLAIISILAEERKNDKVISMCKNISELLRYSNHKTLELTTLKEEISYVENYLICMSARLEEDLEYYINLEPGMEDIAVQRILIQPLVENSITHGFVNEPPWSVQITGKIVQQRWIITVRDNGIGFDKELLDKFNNKEESNIIDNEHIGLTNTQQRLKLIYKENTIFKISNNKDGGASVTIGGEIR